MAWMVRIAIGVGVLALILVTLAFGPGALDARYFRPTPMDPDLDALFGTMTAPELTEPGLQGAEDLEPGPDGRLYASLADGRIMARAPEGGWEEIANTGGRPLGLGFGPDGRLYVADALEGLLRRDGSVWTVMAAAGPFPDLVFTDDLTVLSDGSVIVSDASARYSYGAYLTSFLEGEQTGRIFRIGPDGARTLLADGMAFANGVTEDPATGRIFINETWAGRVHVLDLQSGEMSVLIDGLPGYPDNLHWDAQTGVLWIALPSRRSPDLEAMHARPLLKRLMWRLIQVMGLPPLPPRPVMALGVSGEGEPVAVLYGPDGGESGITTVVPWQGRLWVAGLDRPDVEAFALPQPLATAP